MRLLHAGYMIMTAVDMIRRLGVMDRETIRHELEGNICRCTGYVNIVTAIEDASRRVAGNAEKARHDPCINSSYKRAGSVEEAAHGAARGVARRRSCSPAARR